MTYPAVRAGIVIAIFAALAIGSSLVDAATAALSDDTLPLGLAIARNGFVWLLFGALSFLAIFVARRFPLEPNRLARHLPAHLGAFVAQGPDGALYIADDQRGRIYRVTYGR